MSGGSYNYAYSKFIEFAEGMKDNNNPRRLAFKKLIMAVAEAAKAIEWVDSGDYGHGDEFKVIDHVFDHLGDTRDRLAYKAAGYDKLMEILIGFKEIK